MPTKFNGVPCLAAAIAGLCMFGSSASAVADSAYPNRSISMVVPFAPGGGADTLARILAPELSRQLGQTIVVENKGGASGLIGEQFMATTRPDGYSIMLDSSSFITKQYLYSHLSYTSESFIPIGLIARFRMIAVVTPNFPVKNVAELISMAKQKPLLYATGGVGSAQDLAAHMFMALTGVKMGMVAYRGGGPAMVDVMSGHIPLLFGDGSSAITPVRQGTLRAIGVSGQGRLPALPNVPSFQEQGVKLDLYEWNAILVPANTPPEVVESLRAALAKSLTAPVVAKKIEELGGEQLPGGTEGALKFLAEQSSAVSKIIKDAGIHADSP